MPDYFVLQLQDYHLGYHLIRIEVTFDNETVEPEFLMVPIVSQPYIDLIMEPMPEIEVMQGGVATVPILFQNLMNDTRCPYFMFGKTDPNFDLDVWGNASIYVPPMGESFFDVFIRAQPDAPINGTIETEIVAMTIEGHRSPPVRIRARVVPPNFGIVANPPSIVYPVGPPTVTVSGWNFTPGTANIYLSRDNETPIGSAIVDLDGTFETMVSIPKVPPGRYSIAAVDDQGRLAWTAFIVASVDFNGDGKVNVYDLRELAKRYGKTDPP